MGLTRVAITRPLATLMLIVALVIIGAVSYTHLKVDRLPNISVPFVSVNSSWANASPEDVEQFLVKPLEAAVSGAPNVASISSTSSAGRGSINIQLAEGADADKAAVDIGRRVASARRSIPTDATDPSVNKADPNASPILNIAMAGDRPQSELYDLAANTIQPKLQSIPGVAVVNVSGDRVQQIQIQADLNRMAGYGVTFAQIQSALSRENVNTPIGTATQGRTTLNLRSIGLFQNLDDLRNLIVSSTGNAPNGQVSSGGGIKLSQIANVVETTADVTSYQRFNGKDAVGLSITKQSDANSLQVADAVRTALQNIQKALPADVALTVTNDSSRFTRSSLDAVQTDLGLAVLLVATVLLIFLHSWRNVLIVVLAIPTSLISTFIVMFAFGFSLDTISLMALALVIGILVDDSIVVIENVHRHLKMGESPMVASLNGRGEIGMAAIAITLVDVVVYLPIAFMSGNIGQLFREYGITIAIATLFSLFISFTLTPMLASRLLTAEHEPGHRRRLVDWIELPLEKFGRVFDRGWNRLAGGYGWTLRKALRVRPLVILLAVASLGGAILMIQTGVIGREYSPAEDDGQLTVSVQMPTGTSLDATNAAVAQVENIVKTYPEIDQIFTSIRSGGGFGGGGASGDIDVQLKPKSARSRSIFQIIDDMRPKMRVVQDANVGFQIQNPLLGGGQNGMRIQLLGDDFTQLQQLSQKVVAAVKDIPGVQDLRPPNVAGVPELQFVANRATMADLGVSEQTIATTLRTAYAGTTVGTYQPAGELQQNVILIAQPSDRADVKQLSTVPLVANGGIVRVDQLVQLVNASGPANITRQDRQRTLSISAGISGRPLDQVAKDVRAAIAGIQVPDGYQIVVGGSVQSLDTIFISLMSTLTLSILLIYMLMVALYEHWLHPLTIMFALPVALVGAVLGLWITGNTLNLYSMIGVIMLMGLVAKNGILLVDYTNTLRARGKSKLEALIEAGPIRLKPIVMTTATIVMAMTPLVLKLEAGAESRAPLAIVVIGGVLSSTLLTLFVVPAVYLYLDDFGAFVMRIFFGRRPVPAPMTPAPATFPVAAILSVPAANGNGANGSSSGAPRRGRWLRRS